MVCRYAMVCRYVSGRRREDEICPTLVNFAGFGVGDFTWPPCHDTQRAGVRPTGQAIFPSLCEISKVSFPVSPLFLAPRSRESSKDQKRGHRVWLSLEDCFEKSLLESQRRARVSETTTLLGTSPTQKWNEKYEACRRLGSAPSPTPPPCPTAPFTRTRASPRKRNRRLLSPLFVKFVSGFFRFAERECVCVFKLSLQVDGQHPQAAGRERASPASRGGVVSQRRRPGRASLSLSLSPSRRTRARSRARRFRSREREREREIIEVSPESRLSRLG